MRTGFAVLLACGLLGLASPPPCRGEVATIRLGTGLRPDAGAGGLPELWVAPAKTAPTIDGRVEAAEWAAARTARLGGLQKAAKLTPATVVRMLHAGRVLYLAVEADEPNMAGLQRTVTEDDGPAYRDDSIELFLSPFPAQGYFQFIFSAGGAVFDRRDHGHPTEWNGGAQAAVRRGEKGWSLEAAIPMARMGVTETVPLRWRANVYRNRQAGKEGSQQALSPTLSSGYDVPDRFGFLLFTPEPPAEPAAPADGGKAAIALAELPDGRAVLTFDLSGLPAGATVHRARLLAAREGVDGNHPDAMLPIEIFPLAAAFEEGKAPLHDAKPLALVGPWFDAFDATELVRAWAAGKRPNHGLYVRQFPGWKPAETFLEILYEGRPAAVPPQAADVRAVHRSGQTFITWREIEQLVGEDEINWGRLKPILDAMDLPRRVRYVVYRHDRPITAANLHAAEPIATVRALSCWNVNGRNVERGIDWHLANRYSLQSGHWNPFAQADQDARFGPECPIDRLVIADGAEPLARGTGLYVHTAAEAGQAYYAVLTQIDGVRNTIEISAANTAGPVRETVAEPTPVLQRTLPPLPFWDYPETRLHYVRWVGPPYVNVPCQYYNWSVAIPTGEAAGKRPLELSLHRDDRSYWRTQYRIERDSIVLTPHDFPVATWWYGYHESLGTLRSFADGVVQPYTERRLLWFVKWAVGEWPVDPARVLVTSVLRRAGGAGASGNGAGCSGALHLAMRHPDCFQMALPGSNARVDYRRELHPTMTALWGPLERDARTDAGRSVWDELDLVRLVEATPAGRELPLVTFVGGTVPERVSEFIGAMLAGGRAVLTRFDQWPGPKLLPVSATGTWGGVMLRRDVRADLLLPTFGREQAEAFRNRQVTYAWLNMGLAWGGPVLDSAEGVRVSLWRDRNFRPPAATSVTLRRVQRFRLKAGETVTWSLGDAGGEATVGADGLLTIPNVPIPEKPAVLSVRRKG